MCCKCNYKHNLFPIRFKWGYIKYMFMQDLTRHLFLIWSFLSLSLVKLLEPSPRCAQTNIFLRSEQNHIWLITEQILRSAEYLHFLRDFFFISQWWIMVCSQKFDKGINFLWRHQRILWFFSDIRKIPASLYLNVLI